MAHPKRRHTDRHKPPLLGVLLLLTGLFIIGGAVSTRADIEGGVGVSQSIYADETSNEWTFGGQLGYDSIPVYLWASYEAPRVKMLGQPMGDTDIFSVGLGASQEVVEGLSLFVEVGYSFMDFSPNDEIVQEVSYTQLVGRHNVAGRAIPVPCARGPKCYASRYDIEDEFVGRLGASWQVTDHIALRGSYKWAQYNQEISIKRPDWQEGQGYWREDNQLDLSAFEVGVWYTF